MKEWHERFFSRTRSEIIHILRRTQASARDLAEELDLTTNAIRSHLTKLERDRLVQEAGKRPGVRKPETLYTLTPEAETLFPRAYALLLSHMLDGLKERLSAAQIQELLREIGYKTGVPSVGQADDLEGRVDRAMETLEELGGVAKLEEDDGSYLIRGQSCPVGALVDDHPEVCQIVQALLERISRASVREMCERGDAPRCVFQIG